MADISASISAGSIVEGVISGIGSLSANAIANSSVAGVGRILGAASSMVYQAYYDHYEADHSYIDNVDFRVRLLDEWYSPMPNHIPLQTLSHVVMFVPSAVVGDIITTQSMGNILEAVKERVIERIREAQERLTEVLATLDRFDGPRAERLTEIFTRIFEATDDRMAIWHDMRESGVKYFCVEDATNHSLCWCEEIT